MRLSIFVFVVLLIHCQTATPQAETKEASNQEAAQHQSQEDLFPLLVTIESSFETKISNDAAKIAEAESKGMPPAYFLPFFTARSMGKITGCWVAAKRGGNRVTVTLEEYMAPAKQRELDVLALDDALTELSRMDSQQTRIVEMRFFGGCR